MNTHDALRTRRTAHLWSDAPVPEAVIQRGLEAAHMAPCHRLTWPWRFTLPGPEARATLFDLGVHLKAARAQASIDEAYRAKFIEKLKNPALIVVSQEIVDDPMRFEEDYAACACAIQNLCLSVHADGFHSKWSTGGLTRHEHTYAALDIDPNQERIIGFVWIGVPSKIPNAPKRPELTPYVRHVP